MNVSQQFLQLNSRKKQLSAEYQAFVPSEKPVDLSPINLSKDNYQHIDSYIKTKTLHSCLNPKLTFQKYTPGSPIILVYCQPGEELKSDYPYVAISYCSWIESAGARCIAVPWNLTQNTMQYLVQHSNGLLVPGGNSNLYKVYNTKQGIGNVTAGFKKLWKYVNKQWQKGVHYPIWGTCLGFELILLAISGDMKILNGLNSKGHTQNIYSFYEQSNILKNMPVLMRANVQNKKLLNFTHMNGLSMNRFLFAEQCQSLRKQLKFISGAKDKDNKWFCAFLEGRTHPIYISQFHPEKQSYQWNPNAVIDHNYEAIEVSQYLANQFVQQCRKNSNKFATKQQQDYNLIYHYTPVFNPECKYFQVYYIDFKYKKKSDVKNPRVARTSIKGKPQSSKSFK